MQHEKPRKGLKRVLGFVVILVLIAAITVGGTLLALKHALKGSGGADDAAQSTDLPQENVDAPEQKPVADESMSDFDAQTYYDSIGDVETVTDVSESDAVCTESEAAKDFADRGFTGEITTPYSMAGKILDDQMISHSSDRMHPLYRTYYRTPDGALWCITAVNGAMTAEPLSFLSDADADIPTLLSERKTVTAYDSVTGAFYEFIPNPEACALKIVDRIDAAFLDDLTWRDVESL